MSIVKTPCSSSTSSSGTTPSSSNRSYDRTGETSTDETPDSNKLTSSVRMMVMGSGNQDGTRGRPPSDHGSQDMSDEYVTFYFPQQLSTHSRRSDGMVSDTGTSDDAHIYDVPCVVRESPVTSTPGPGYDNLTNLWTCTNNHHRTSDHFAVTGLPANVQRVQSFNSSTCSSDCSYCLHPVRPDVLRLQGSPQLPEMLLDADGSPTTPAVWLKQQQDHLADGAIKAGSLPRSFQLNQESPSPSVDQDGTGECLAAFKLRRLADRPFTIASDKPSQSDLNLDDFERYIEDSPTKQPGYRFPVGRQDSEDLDSSATTDTAAESTEDITGTFVHPEHRIYRPSLSRSSLRSLIASVGSRLAGLKTHPHTPSGSASRDASETDHSCSCSSINTETDERDVLVSSQTSITGRTRFIERERTTSRLMVSVAHVYSRMLGHRARTQMKATPTEKGSRSTSPTAIANTFHRQGSPAIGARMAKPLNDYDYGTSGPKRSGNSCCGNRGSRPRPDSILSLTLEWGSSIRDLKDDENEIVISENTNEPTTNHLKETTVPQSQAPLVDSKVAEDISDGSEEGNATPPTPSNKLITGQEEANSDASADSYYERTFEAIEGFLENDLFRDSAVYSDSEEATDGSGAVISQDHDGKLPETLSESKTSSVSKDCVQTETPNNEWQPPTNDESPSIEISEDASSDIINRRLSNDEMKSQRPVKGQSILEKVRYLEQCSQYSHIKEVPISVENLKPIKERCRDLELWSLGSCREQEGDATDDTVGSQDSSLDRGPVEGAGSMGMLSPTDSTVSRGWVRQIVDRFQNDS